MHRFEDALVVVVARFANDHVVRVDAVGHDARFVEGVKQPRRADDIGAAARRLRANEIRRCQCAGVEVALVHLQPHAREFNLQLLRRLAAGVRQK
ncbi:hypothetical protein SDC9_176596 [bioreactor metagenome]|uniref:Uncharacterized protein n=1 Tax=bioreactor metagenome TaxID=1076179 RepID=A0A645GR31_9ZZZZ